MAYIREPEGVDFIVGPATLTEADAQMIRQAIAAYKNRQGKTMSFTEVVQSSVTVRGRRRRAAGNSVLVRIKKAGS